ncbi:DUF116 domain-containing protein [Clostridium vincentii]|uniref:DUF116 domain-containing protein n=1 Tax=Clostridium vincentii TaxID=52704 RepID=A0A2T0B7C2_9CLOT|nr:DUF116 domain-containing protein [Clostridium vincentii]PRR79790.1 hypothetical protein CLVI_32360 [Clostridium vincentii]
MNYLTYSLKLDNEDSNEYYELVSKISKDFTGKCLRDTGDILKDFMCFIENNEIENLRTREEYFIELLLIGVVIKEYINNARAFKVITRGVFSFLNKLRMKSTGKNKYKIDELRGKLMSKILIKKKYVNKNISLDDIKLIIKWLQATGDFNEEVIRLNNWMKFLENRNNEYIDKVVIECENLNNYLNDIGEKQLHIYTENVESYLKTYGIEHKYKEDYIYCGKSEIQYYFNMVSAEIMNDVYKEKFLKCRGKLVFLPACMRQINTSCKGIIENMGYKCINCSKVCNVSKLTALENEYKFKVYTIPHESLLFNTYDEENNQVGVIGIACVLNLISGGWKALRLGFNPQCIVLDYCGCSNHWMKKPLMTNINYNRLKELTN